MVSTMDFLAKLSNVDFTNTKEEEGVIIGSFNGTSVEVSLSTKIWDNINEAMPIQAMLNVWVDGSHVSVWGAESNKDNFDIISWFRANERDAKKAMEVEKESAKRNAKALFSSI